MYLIKTSEPEKNYSETVGTYKQKIKVGVMKSFVPHVVPPKNLAITLTMCLQRSKFTMRSKMNNFTLLFVAI